MAYNWRDDGNIFRLASYARQFAWYPISTTDGLIWLKHYYIETYLYYYGHNRIQPFKREHSANISEQEYIVRKLSGTAE